MIENLLTIGDLSMLLFKEGQSRITIGVPHHTPKGIPNMPCMEHRPGDENTGQIGWFLAERLKGSFVCAINYFLDPNKSPNTDYSIAVAKTAPTYLIEIHGHGKVKSKYDIEISCGSEEEESVAQELKDKIGLLIQTDQNFEQLKGITAQATFSKLHFKATGTATIQDKRWKAIHIELSPVLRKDPEISPKFIELLYKALRAVCHEAINV